MRVTPTKPILHLKVNADNVYATCRYPEVLDYLEQEIENVTKERTGETGLILYSLVYTGEDIAACISKLLEESHYKADGKTIQIKGIPFKFEFKFNLDSKLGSSLIAYVISLIITLVAQALSLAFIGPHAIFPAWLVFCFTTGFYCFLEFAVYNL